MAMGHEYCGVVEEVGSAVTSVRPGEFVVGSFCLSDNTCPHCRFGFQSSCEQREFMSGAQAPVARFRSQMARWSPRQRCPPMT
jgi:threonine dehydrogenase-like Zn-dependent dehydrogenase